MATTTLTPKQQQVKTLLEQGKTPAEVAKKLKVNVNSVYQHIRRMKAAEGETAAKPKRTPARKSTARKTGGKRTPARKSTARKNAARKPSRPRPAPAPAPAPVAEVRQMTPLQAIRHRREHIEAEIRESAQRLAAATKAFENEADAHGKLEGSRAAELKQLAQAEAALSDAKPKPKRSRSAAKSSNGAGSKDAAAKAAAQTPAASVPAATPEPQSAGTEPDPTPAENAGTTGSTTDAPEPVEPPTGDEALAAVGAEEERPGVPTVPEFEQGGEDPFAG